MTLTIREPGSALTHFIGFLMALVGAAPMMARAAVQSNNGSAVEAMAIFMMSMASLYLASTVYHSVTVKPRVLRVFRKIDHMMIFVLIAGSYTPICLLALPGVQGQRLLLEVWAVAIAGIVIKLFWITCPKWFSSVLYIGMGWLCVSVMGALRTSLTAGGFGWLLAGGIIYTVGGVIYALKLPIFDSKHKNFGSHEIFHLFVMGGSFCHFICMYSYILK